MAVLLESPVTSSTNLARYSICAGSPRVIDGQFQLWTPPVGEILPFLRAPCSCRSRPTYMGTCVTIVKNILFNNQQWAMFWC